MKTFVLLCQVTFGLVFLVVDAITLLELAPMPTPPPDGMAFMVALNETGYLMPVIKTVEIVTAIMLVFNFMAPLALVLLAPISLNIFLYHLFLAPSGLGLAIIILCLHIFLGIVYFDSFKAMFKIKAPTAYDNRKWTTTRKPQAEAVSQTN